MTIKVHYKDKTKEIISSVMYITEYNNFYVITVGNLKGAYNQPIPKERIKKIEI